MDFEDYFLHTEVAHGPQVWEFQAANRTGRRARARREQFDTVARPQPAQAPARRLSRQELIAALLEALADTD
ncbi:hypothetical protein P3T76_005742 [Phytophthora citrophthora]|uniref:Uncharacterized protein n=1 Tax=Phytophthora citrophthora TaxID=4793 RepID=A0AAD9GQZ8_9STRA|nr:hypothetical protein P3T76_005742 [Phytophthora citrophthora]